MKKNSEKTNLNIKLTFKKYIENNSSNLIRICLKKIKFNLIRICLEQGYFIPKNKYDNQFRV